MSISRRNFLKGLGVLGVSLSASEFLSLAAQAATKGARGNKVLIVIQLAGGNDGLNTLVPCGDEDARQSDARPAFHDLAPGQVFCSPVLEFW